MAVTVPDYLQEQTPANILSRLLVKLGELRPDLDLNTGSWIYDILTAIATGQSDGAVFTRQMFDRIWVQSTPGEMLDVIGEHYGIRRREATFASGLVRFTGAPGTVIPATTVVTAPGSILAPPVSFSTVYQDSISATGTTVDIEVLAALAGSSGNANAGSVNFLQDSIAGISSVINPETFTGGADIEGHEDYRARILQTLNFPPGSGDVGSYMQWALDGGAERAWVIPVEDGPGTVSVYVLNEDLEIPDQELIDAVQDYIVAPVSTTVEVERNNNPEYTVSVTGPGTSLDPAIEGAYGFGAVKLEYDVSITASAVITDATRATATEGDGLSGDSSMGIWPAVTNLVTNGGFQTNTTGWTTGGTNTLSRVTEQFKFGTHSGKTAYSNNATLFSYAITLTAAVHSVSAWVYIPTNYDGGGVQLQADSFAGAGGTLTASANMSLRDQWQRLKLTFTPVGGDLAGFILVVNTGGAPTAARAIYLDGVQVEQHAISTPYVQTDGGTAARTLSAVTFDAANLATDQGWVAIAMRPGWSNANEPGGGAALLGVWDWRDDASNRLTLTYDEANNRFDFYRATGGTGTSLTRAATITDGTTVVVVAAWTATDLYLMVTGDTAFVTDDDTNVPSLADTTVSVMRIATASYFEGDVFWIATGTGGLSDADGASIVGFGATDPNLNSFNDDTEVTMVWDAVLASGPQEITITDLEIDQAGLWNMRVRLQVDDISSGVSLITLGVYNVTQDDYAAVLVGGPLGAAVTSYFADAFDDVDTWYEFSQGFYADGSDEFEFRVIRNQSDNLTTVFVDRVTVRSTFSDGLGDGLAPIGAKVSVRAPEADPHTVAATIFYDPNYDSDDVDAAIETGVEDYFKSRSLVGETRLVYASIGHIISALTPGVLYAEDLLLDGAAVDVVIADDGTIPTLSTLTLTPG